MSDSVSAAYDDYDDYKRLCEFFGEAPHGIYEVAKWCDHNDALEVRRKAKFSK